MSNEPTSPETWTIGRLLTWTTDFLRGKGCESPRLEAEVLLAHARGCERIELYTAFAEEPSEAVRTAFRDLVKRRAGGTPVAYLVGNREFFSLTFHVTPDVLIPRPETELLIVRALDLARERDVQKEIRIADVGTGSGNIAVSCAKHLPNSRVTAIDISPAAVVVAENNAEQHQVADRVEFVVSDLFTEIPSEEQYDLILSNPPYISSAEMEDLEPTVREHEPHLALDGGEGGTEVIERLIPLAAERLVPGGWILVEVSPSNASRVESLLGEQPMLAAHETINDLAGLARVVQAQKKSD